MRRMSIVRLFLPKLGFDKRMNVQISGSNLI